MADRIRDLSDHTATKDYVLECDSFDLGSDASQQISIDEAVALTTPDEPVWIQKAFINDWDGDWRYRIVKDVYLDAEYLEMFIEITDIGADEQIGTLTEYPDWYVRVPIIINTSDNSQIFISNSGGQVVIPDYASVTFGISPIYFKVTMTKPTT